MQGISLLPLEPGATRMQLRCREGWASAYPQSAHLLREEVLAWDKTPWKLDIAGI
jgi:exopolyphosphatase/guanosine-5'-triphosphate,3'-diphosphate pyrophosphatase